MLSRRLIKLKGNHIGFIEPATLHEKTNNFRKTCNTFANCRSRTNTNADIKVVKVFTKERKIQKIDPTYRLEGDSLKFKRRPNTKLEINTRKDSRNYRDQMCDKQTNIEQSYNSSKQHTNEPNESINIDTLELKNEELGVCWGQVLNKQNQDCQSQDNIEYKSEQIEKLKRIQPRKCEREILLKQGQIIF